MILLALLLRPRHVLRGAQMGLARAAKARGDMRGELRWVRRVYLKELARYIERYGPPRFAARWEAA